MNIQALRNIFRQFEIIFAMAVHNISFFLGVVKIARDLNTFESAVKLTKTFVVMRFSTESSTASCWTSGVADSELFCFSDEFLHELVVDRLVDINTLSAKADLALISEAAHGTTSCCGVDIRVLELLKSWFFSPRTSKTSAGFFPPSSSETFFTIGAVFSIILAPIAVDPVKEISGTSGCKTSASPASCPYPKTMLQTPAGRPASTINLHSSNAVVEVISEGLHTQVFPNARAGPIFQESKYNGRF
jgi:hypothetical protein